jgi:hypothetical protein
MQDGSTAEGVIMFTEYYVICLVLLLIGMVSYFFFAIKYAAEKSEK